MATIARHGIPRAAPIALIAPRPLPGTTPQSDGVAAAFGALIGIDSQVICDAFKWGPF
jgi:hypothetical protein